MTEDDLKSENERLRAALIACGRNVGAYLSDAVSTDFLLLVPEEVRLIMARHRKALERLASPEAFTVPRIATKEETARMEFADKELYKCQVSVTPAD